MVKIKTGNDLTIQPATKEDLGDILSIVSAVDLPTDGIKEHLAGFLVARDAVGNLLGTIGLERHGQVGLLRSAAVSPGMQRLGLGTMLTSRLIADASAAGVSTILLLTSTASLFFEERFGFSVGDRNDYDSMMAGSQEWLLPRCSSAIMMKLELKG